MNELLEYEYRVILGTTHRNNEAGQKIKTNSSHVLFMAFRYNKCTRKKDSDKQKLAESSFPKHVFPSISGLISLFFAKISNRSMCDFRPFHRHFSVPLKKCTKSVQENLVLFNDFLELSDK
jgi:hypothetical protein